MDFTVSMERKLPGESIPNTTTARAIKPISSVMVGSPAIRCIGAGRAFLCKFSEFSGDITGSSRLLTFSRIGGGADAEQNHQTGDDTEGIRRHSNERQTIFQNRKKDDPKDRSTHRPYAAHQARPS